MSSALLNEDWAGRFHAVFKYNVITWEEALVAAKAEGFREGWAEGLREGQAEGFHDGLAAALRNHLKRRPESLPDWIDQRLDHASQQELDSLIDRVLEAKHLEDVFGPE